MSTSETVEFDLGPCPCGKTQLVKIVTTQDNPWSSADISYELRCAPCSKSWRTSGASMTLVSSEAEFDHACDVRDNAFDAAMAVASEIVQKYFKAFAAPSKKAQHAEMVKLGITGLSYRLYLDALKGGKAPHQIASPLLNRQWLLMESAKQGLEDKLKPLLTAVDSAESAWSAASKKIIRKRFE